MLLPDIESQRLSEIMETNGFTEVDRGLFIVSSDTPAEDTVSWDPEIPDIGSTLKIWGDYEDYNRNEEETGEVVE